MKPAFLCIAGGFLMASAFVASALGATDGGNLVINGGFEDGTKGWDLKQDRWVIEGATIEITDEISASGGYCLKLDPRGTEGGMIAASGQYVPVKPFTRYRITASVYRAGAAAGYTKIGGEAMDANKEHVRRGQWWYGVYPIELIPGVGREWERYTKYFTVRRGEMAYLELRFWAVGSNGHPVYIDDVEVVEDPLPPAPPWELKGAVQFPGSPSKFGMKVESAQATDDGFEVVTTGARYVLSLGPQPAMVCRQRIEQNRPVATVALPDWLRDLKLVLQNEDVCVLANDEASLGFQGDSLVVLASNRDCDFQVEGNITPQWLQYRDAHLLAIDDWGGFCVFPAFRQDYQSLGASSSVDILETPTAPGWTVPYTLHANERVALAVFPPRPYDWNTSFNRRVVNTYGLPSAEQLEEYRKYCQVLLLFSGIYMRDSKPPYQVSRPGQTEAIVQKAHDLGMEVITYINCERYENWDSDLERQLFWMQLFKDAYKTDGFYFDGLFTTDWVKSYEFIRRVREMVGDSIIYTHCTLNPPLGADRIYAPFIDVYSDYILRGEGQTINGVNDPYMRYVIGSYRISNSIPTLKPDGMKDATPQEILAAMLALHGRERWAYPGIGGSVERDKLMLEHYFPELDRQKSLWEQGQLSPDIEWPME